MKIKKKHPFTGKENVMDLDITIEQLNRWNNGEYIQDVMPQLSADEREFLITGLLPGEYDQMFKYDDEE